MRSNSNDVKETDPSLRSLSLEEENRDLRRRLDQTDALVQRLLSLPAYSIPAEPSSVSHTPLSRSPAYVRVPEQRRPPSSAVRSLSFRQPPPAPIAPSSAALPDEGEEEEMPPSPSLTVRSRNLKVPVPKLFAGTMKERASADTWLHSVAGWLRLAAPGESDEVLILLFATVLDISPKKWLMNFQHRAEAAGRQLTLQDVFDEFVLTYFGGLSQKMAEQQLNSLVYGKGECKDLAATDSEFDRLAQQLYPGSEDSPAAIALLARIYSETIRKGDDELWEKAMDAQPSTVDEWKAAVQNAYIVIETKKAHQSRARADRQEVRTSFYSRSSPSTSTSTSVQVKKVEHDEASDERQAPKDPKDEEELQKTEVRGHLRSGSRSTSTSGGLGSHLTHKQRMRLKDLDKCWICLEKAHRSFECEKKGKPGYPRNPTAEDLKA